MVERLLHEYRPEDVVELLAPYLTPERRARIERVLAARLKSLTVVIENLHDPHNGAAAIRSAEAFGLCELHVVEEAEPFRFSPKVTQGCDKWIEIRRHADFAACARALHDRGFVLYAAIPGAERAVHEIDATRPAALVFGNEHAGLTSAARAACDASFGIPIHGFTQSFNLSVSVALAIYDLSTRRRAALGAPGDLDEGERLGWRARWYALSLDERAVQGILERARPR